MTHPDFMGYDPYHAIRNTEGGDQPGQDEPHHNREPEPPEPEDEMLTLEEIEQLLDETTGALDPAGHQLLDVGVPQLLARVRMAEVELAEWRGRQQRYEYGVTRPGEEPPPIVQVGRREVEQAWANPELGTPWVRVITTSKWHKHQPPPS